MQQELPYFKLQFYRPYLGMAYFKRLGINISISIITIIVCLSVLEIYARFFLNIKYFDLNIIQPPFNDQIKDRFIIYDGVIGFIPGPAWTGGEGMYGFQNGREYLNSKHKDKNMVIIGDSIIQYRFLEKVLKDLLKDKNYKVWNAGIGGYNTIQEAYYLERHIKIRPDILILGFCLNDFMPSMTLVPHDSQLHRKTAQLLFEPLGFANPFLFAHSALYRYIKLKTVYLAKKEDLWSTATVLHNRQAVYKALDKMRKFCLHKDIPFLVIIYPHLREFSPTHDDWFAQAHVAIVEILSTLGIKYIDLYDNYRNIGFEKLQIRSGDIVHSNIEGNFIAAQELIIKFYAELGLSRQEADNLTSITFGQYEKKSLSH